MRVTVLAVAGLLGVASLEAQPVPQRVSVPFKFNMMDKAYPGAAYYFLYEATSNQLEIRGPQRNVVARLPVITRLAPGPGAVKGGNVRLVFDQVGEERFLSEVWIPGYDGLLVRATAERHKHATVDTGEK